MSSGKAQGDAVAPALRRQRFRGDRAHRVVRLDPQAPARGNRRHRSVRALQGDVLVGVAHEFGNDAETPDTPSSVNIGKMTGKKV
jgi:hypothetical protein